MSDGPNPVDVLASFCRVEQSVICDRHKVISPERRAELIEAGREQGIAITFTDDGTAYINADGTSAAALIAGDFLLGFEAERLRERIRFDGARIGKTFDPLPDLLAFAEAAAESFGVFDGNISMPLSMLSTIPTLAVVPPPRRGAPGGKAQWKREENRWKGKKP